VSQVSESEGSKLQETGERMQESLKAMETMMTCKADRADFSCLMAATEKAFLFDARARLLRSLLPVASKPDPCGPPSLGRPESSPSSNRWPRPNSKSSIEASRTAGGWLERGRKGIDWRLWDDESRMWRRSAGMSGIA
jgi:hypothetical protein